MTAEELLAPFEAPVRDLATAARRTIAAVHPAVTERVYQGWRGIGYRHPAAGYLCCIFPFPGRVDIAFEYGVLLEDPDGLLIKGPTGSKRVRYLRMLPGQPAPLAQLAGFVAASLALRSA